MIKLNKKYEPLFINDTRYFVLTGGRGSAKSFAISTFGTILSYERGHKMLFTRNTMTSAHLSIIPEYQEKIELMGVGYQFKINNADILNWYSGSEIIFKGLKTSSGDQTANLKSLQGISTWIMDEAEELVDEAIFDKINLSIRAPGVQNRIVLVLNPQTKEHWIYRRFFQDAGVQEGFNGVKGDTTYIHTSYLDNIEHLPEDYLFEIEKIRTTNPVKYDHVILGGWLDKSEGVVFENWSYGEFNPGGLQTSCGLDFGYSVDPDALVEVAIDKKKKKLYLKQHIYQRGLQSHVLAEKILSAVGKMFIVADSAEPRLISDLKYKGVNIEAVKKGTIESGITRMLDFEIIVDPNSNDIAKELNNHTYADKGSKLFTDSYNHIIDAVRYNVDHHLDNPYKGQYFIY